MRLTIEKIVYPGRRLGRLEGKVVFTDRGLPGEVVEAEVFRDRKSYAEARTSRIVEASADRREPRCGHSLACSPYQDMDYALQLRVKKAQVEEILSRELKRAVEVGEVVPSPEVWGYRNRIQLKALWERERAEFVYNEPGEEASFVPVDRCYLVPERMNDLLAEMRERMNGGPWTSVTGVEIKSSRSNGRSLVVCHLDSGKELAEISGGLEELRLRYDLAGAVGFVFDGKRVAKERLFGRDFIEERVGGLTYRIGARSFFQVNVGILERVFGDMEAAMAGMSDPVVADLYCGLGTFGMFLAGKAREVFGVEADEENVAYLKKNLAANRIGNFAVCEGTSEEWLPEILERRAGVVVLDPPRRGIDARMVEALVRDPVPVVLYLSCNPTTLARDLKPLLAEAYELADIKVYDFFPHTPHIECLAILMGDMIPVSHLGEPRSG
ncbi:MAG: 23S rRNA (uracil(1939)-C(5))-methyltransferase RlmD [Candidatus Aminicenantes bacterium]